MTVVEIDYKYIIILLFNLVHVVTTGKSQTEAFNPSRCHPGPRFPCNDRIMAWNFGPEPPITGQQITWKEKMSPQWLVHLSLWHIHVLLVSRYLFWQLSIDHNVEAHYQVKHRLYIPSGHLASNGQRKENLARLADYHSVRTIVAI